MQLTFLTCSIKRSNQQLHQCTKSVSIYYSAWGTPSILSRAYLPFLLSASMSSLQQTQNQYRMNPNSWHLTHMRAVYTKLVCTCILADTYVTYVCDWHYCYCQKQPVNNIPTWFPCDVYICTGVLSFRLLMITTDVIEHWQEWCRNDEYSCGSQYYPCSRASVKDLSCQFLIC